MSYEGSMLHELKMPSKKDVEDALLISLFRHNGVIREFGEGEEIVVEIANEFDLNEAQRKAQLETIYRKENRLKKVSLWHRLLFRAADSLAKQNLVSRPTQTILLTARREWMLTEEGYDHALQLLHIPNERKDVLPVISFEVQKIVKKLTSISRPDNYQPIADSKKNVVVTREISIRKRGFRQAVIVAYDYKCAVCGLKIHSPLGMIWEVEAAHIVPHASKGKDDVLNGISLCHLHHWAFDVGWFSLFDDYTITVSPKAANLQEGYGQFGSYEFIKTMSRSPSKILLPVGKEIYPHVNAIRWHRENIFNKI